MAGLLINEIDLAATYSQEIPTANISAKEEAAAAAAAEKKASTKVKKLIVETLLSQ